MATLNKLGKGSYEVRWDQLDADGNRHQRRKRFTRLDKAQDFLKNLDPDTPFESETTRFSAWIDSWFAQYKSRLEASTAAGYANLVDRCKKHFGAMLLSKIKPSDIDRFYTLLQSANNELTRNPLSPSSAQRHHALLHRAFEFAVRDNLMKANPCDKVDRPKSSRQEPEMPDIADVQAKINALHGTNMYLPVVVAFMTGMRKSEVLGLKWSDVDYKECKLFVRRVRQYISPNKLKDIKLNAFTRIVSNLPSNIERDYPKGKKIHKVSITPDLCELFRTESKRQSANRLRVGEPYLDTHFVFVDDMGVPLSPNELSKVMRGVCRYHDLRHLNGIYLLRAGHSVADVADHLGHTTPATTLKYYAHAMKDYEKSAASVMSSVITLKS